MNLDEGTKRLDVMSDRLYPDLDYEFLRYTGVVPENMRRIQSFYLQFFQDRPRVLDLACGDGDFVGMLAEQGISATGVDLDPKACEAVRSHGLDVVSRMSLTIWSRSSLKVLMASFRRIWSST
jgi:2-polyprenyl-3-methyl-5-hydroxy-6-metoxy-1,4-benzoquinol methylase